MSRKCNFDSKAFYNNAVCDFAPLSLCGLIRNCLGDQGAIFAVSVPKKIRDDSNLISLLQRSNLALDKSKHAKIICCFFSRRQTRG
jgi:hypothetical protein